MDSDEFRATVDETVVEWKRLGRLITAFMTSQVNVRVSEILATERSTMLESSNP
jgi:hypothetical protein